MGPIVILDKSALQSLSLDEAVWLHAFYSSNITPLFFAETLADLEKEVRGGRSPEQVVGNLALKTSPMGARPNVHHQTLALSDLLGDSVEMRRVPVIGGGRAVLTAGGQSGILFQRSPEQEALERWARGEFLEVERRFARSWRAGLRRLDLRDTPGLLRTAGLAHSLEDAYKLAVREASRDGWRYNAVRAALRAADASPTVARVTLARWRSRGGEPLREFAPYAAHTLVVDLFFRIALNSGLISDRRSSNRIDMAYLYYLPFCMVFVSGDRLHERTVPLFLGPEQVFVKAVDLKSDLARLDAHYSALPDEIRNQGVMRFAQFPPGDGDFLTTQLWDKLMTSNWREAAASAREPLPKDLQDALLLLVKKFSEEATPETGKPLDIHSAAGMVLESRVPVRMGKWRLVPPEAAAAAKSKHNLATNHET